MIRSALPNAVALLRSPVSDDDERIEFLGFRLDQACYAVSIDIVGEILRILPMTVVPRSPRSIMGVVGVRGRVLTVVDLRERLGLASPEPTRQARILVLPWSDNESVGLYVDSVLRVYRFSTAEIEPAAAGFGREASGHVTGIARADGQLVLIIRPEPFLELVES